MMTWILKMIMMIPVNPLEPADHQGPRDSSDGRAPVSSEFLINVKFIMSSRNIKCYSKLKTLSVFKA